MHRVVRLVDVDGLGDRHPARPARQPEHLGAVALGVEEVAADRARVVDDPLDAVAVGPQAPMEVAKVVEARDPHRDLLDEMRVVSPRGRPRISAIS